MSLHCVRRGSAGLVVTLMLCGCSSEMTQMPQAERGGEDGGAVQHGGAWGGSRGAPEPSRSARRRPRPAGWRARWRWA